MGEGKCELIKGKLDLVETRFDYKFEQPDRNRLEYAFDLVTGNSVLDIGIADGALVSAASELPGIQTATAIDIRWHSRLIKNPKVQYHQLSLLDEDFDIKPHDTVFCMEVIEHLYPKDNALVIPRLRSVAARRLVISVPYQEPEPLWWHDKPGGHRQRFTMDKLAELFPSAVATFLPRFGVDWILLIEDRGLPADRFMVFSRRGLKDYLRDSVPARGVRGRLRSLWRSAALGRG